MTESLVGDSNTFEKERFKNDFWLNMTEVT